MADHIHTIEVLIQRIIPKVNGGEPIPGVSEQLLLQIESNVVLHQNGFRGMAIRRVLRHLRELQLHDPGPPALCGDGRFHLDDWRNSCRVLAMERQFDNAVLVGPRNGFAFELVRHDLEI